MQLLRLLDANLVTAEQMRGLLMGLHGEAALLRNPQTRSIIFDLLRPGEATHVARLLDLPTDGDCYATLQNLTVRRGSDREQWLFDAFGVTLPVTHTVSLPESQRSAAAITELFKYQRDIARKARAALQERPHRVLLHMPTGSGKTRTAMQIVADHLRIVEPTLVFWLAYSEELCEQAATEFEQAWRHLGNRTLTVQRFWGAHELDLATCHDGIVVASLSKLYNAGKSSLAVISTLANRCSLTVMDEAHQAIAATYELVLSTLVNQGRGALLGLSATPGRTWNDREADAQLADFFGGHKISLDVEGYDNPINYLIDQGYLARAQFRPLFFQNGNELSAADLRQIEQQLDIPTSILRRYGEDEQRNLRILVEIGKLLQRHNRLIVFAASVEHATLLAAVLRAQGVHANAVSGETAPAVRQAAIAAYKANSDEPRILCNYGVLTTGFDAPTTSAAVIARPTTSLVLYSQMVGRAMRGTRVGGNASAEIVTVVDSNLPGFGTVADAFTNWEDVWRNL